MTEQLAKGRKAFLIYQCMARAVFIVQGKNIHKT